MPTTHTEYRETIRQNAAILQRFRDQLQKLADTLHAEAVAEYVRQRCHILQHFIDKRQPNETASEYEQRTAGFKGLAQLAAAASTHPTWRTYKGNGKFHQWQRDTNRPAFKVRIKKAVLRDEANRYATGMVETFTHKATSKVYKVLIARPDYSCTLSKGNLYDGRIEADLRFDWPDGCGFRTHLILKWVAFRENTMRQYGQYPLTFHDATFPTGDTAKVASEATILKHFLLTAAGNRGIGGGRFVSHTTGTKGRMMAKKKAASGGPTRECEGCGERYHPRKKECPHCGAANPAMAGGPKKKVVKKKAAPAGDGGAAPAPAQRVASTAGGAVAGASDAVAAVGAAGDLIEAAGSIDNARALLDQIERVTNR